MIHNQGWSSETMQDTNASYNESPYNGRGLVDHKNDLNCCVDHLKDIIHDYVETEVLTPGEFVNCVRDALSDNINYHSKRLNMLKDAETLLTNTNREKELLQE